MNFFKFFFKKAVFFIPCELLGAIAFESKSYFYNRMSGYLKINANQKNYINLGSGSKIINEFINIDFYGTPGINYGADLRKHLKISNNVVDGIFCEHTLEHLTYSDVDRLLGECYRILKDGGVFRIVLPDLSLFISNYADGNISWFRRWESLMFTHSTDPIRKLRKLNTPLESISFTTQEYGHVSSWDYETLFFYLQKNGFREITKSGYMESRDPALLIDDSSEDRRLVSLYVEAVK
ncbi:methyltransferase domain-containing protein [Polynucleobacter paneuropaeus]|nr:methyltransferase domain-containing protein [Polynucleobacter paneuropaeus]